MGNIVFLSNKNLNRSSAAMLILEKKLAKRNLHASVCSAGFSVDATATTDWKLNKLMLARKYGNLVRHRPQEVNKSLIRDASLVLTMNQRNLDEFDCRFPRAASKAFTLAQYALEDLDSNVSIMNPNRYILDVACPSNNRKYQSQARVAAFLPTWAARPYLRLFADERVSNRDERGVGHIFGKMLDQLDFYIEMAIPRIIREGHAK